MERTDFDTKYSEAEAIMLKDAYDAITACDLWEWMRAYTPEENKGFMFSQHPNLELINRTMKFDGHSGASYGWTMRTMERIAKQPSACPCRMANGYRFGWCGVAGGGVPGCDH